MAVQHQIPTAEAPTGERRSQIERRHEAETALLDAAMRLFARQGVEATSLAAIGDEAGYSRGLANHHFGSRAALVEHLARRGQRRFARGVEHLEGPAIDTVLAVADTYLSLFEDPSDEVRAFFVMRGGAIPHDAPLRTVYAVDDRRFRSGIVRVIEAGQARGTVAGTVDAASFAAMLVGLLRGLASQLLMDPDAFDLASARASTRTFIQTTLRPDHPRSPPEASAVSSTTNPSLTHAD